MKLSQLEVGMTVWSLSRTKMGNTTIKVSGSSEPY